MAIKNICGKCVRFKGNTRHPQRYLCACMNRTDDEVHYNADACEIYWDLDEQQAKEQKRERANREKREVMWAQNSDNPPVKLPIVNDGYGFIPTCPTCNEMPYSTEQCYFCGQKFLKDEEIENYNKPEKAEIKCFNCGGVIAGTKSKYNGHFHGSCKSCGVRVMQ